MKKSIQILILSIKLTLIACGIPESQKRSIDLSRDVTKRINLNILITNYIYNIPINRTKQEQEILNRLNSRYIKSESRNPNSNLKKDSLYIEIEKLKNVTSNETIQNYKNILFMIIELEILNYAIITSARDYKYNYKKFIKNN